jgi:hypothetical protein
VIVLLAGVMSAVRAGSGSAPLRLAVLMANPDGSACTMPCILGIRPGAMTLRQAEVALRRHPLVRALDELNCAGSSAWCYFQLRDLEISGLVRGDRAGRVANVYLLLTGGQSLRLGDFIGALGAPGQIIPHFRCCALDNFMYRVKRSLPSFGFWFYFPNQGFLVRDSARGQGDVYRLQPDSPVIDFMVGEPYRMPENVGFQQRTDYWDRWYGFTTVEHYFDIARLAGPTD